MLTQLDHFYKTTRYDISGFFERFKDFVDNNYDNYVGYYRGISKLDNLTKSKLVALVNESKTIEELFFLNKESLSSNLDFWDLYETFSDCLLKLETIENTPKWTRSSYGGGFDKDIKVNYILKQNQSIEELTSQLGFNNPDNDWVNLAIENNLREVDYDLSGGNLLKVSFAVNNGINTNSVVDVMVGDNVVGKDLFAKLSFEGDDLKFLPPKETINQAASILLSTTTGSVPEFPRDGIDSRFIGSNIKSIQYPSVFRQITALFKKDDTFKEIQVIDLYHEEDNIILSLRMVSKLNDIINQNIYLNE